MLLWFLDMRVLGLVRSYCSTACHVTNQISAVAGMGHTLAHHGARSPETLGFMRKALDLRAVDLVGLLGVGAETVSP